MEFVAKTSSAEKQRSALVVLGVYQRRRLSAAAEQFDAAQNGYLKEVLRRGDLEGKPGQSLLLPYLPGAACERVLLVGCGGGRELDEHSFEKMVSHTADKVRDLGVSEAALYFDELAVKGRDLHWKIRRILHIIADSNYRFDSFKSQPDTTRRELRRIVIHVPTRSDLPLAEQAIAEGVAIMDGVRFAKDLGNTPPNHCHPTWLAEQAQEMAATFATLEARIFDQGELEQMGMNALLAVSRGSSQPAHLIRLDYRQAASSEKPYVLIGKGVTFDSGGISLKPGKGMDEMKFDMCGAASVLGTMFACARLQLPLNVTALIPAVENMPSGWATRPGDIVTSMSGQTIEILNTDAEGRLILCDALTYAEREQPRAVIDVATLTGACVVALGRIPHGLFGNHPPLVRALQQAAHSSSDRVWELPLWEEYQEALDSNFADCANVGSSSDGGSITAACFLARFTKKLHWAHLDIAGTAWKSGKAKGATGRPVSLLTQYLLDRVAEQR